MGKLQGSPMQKWEYKELIRVRTVNSGTQKPTDWDVEIDLNAFGRAGWELVTVVSDGSHQPNLFKIVSTREIWYFKRSID